MSVLSGADRIFWEKNGYVVIPDVVPADNLRAVVDAIWAFLEVDGDNPEAWYRHAPRTKDRPSPISQAGMVEMYQHQSLWDNRQHPRLYEAFADVLATPNLWVSLDRVNMKPPVSDHHPEWDFGGMIHWDVDTSVERASFGVQGVLYLTDTAQDQGGFQCVPGFHNRFEEWVKTQTADRDPHHPDLDGLEVVSIPGKAGDLLIWHNLLAHGNGTNRSDKPRLAQYVTMSPAPQGQSDGRQQRIASWREHRPTGGWPGDPREWESKRSETAELTELGRKLLGLDLW
jgi:hypothetical protein